MISSSAAQSAEPAPEPEASTPQPTQPAEPAESHTIEDGDTLWELSDQYLGSPYEWPRLWSFNPEITNPHWIYPGQSLRVGEGGGAAAAAQPKGLFVRKVTRGALEQRSAVVLLGEEVYLDREALTRTANIVGSSEEHFMLSTTDEVYLSFEEGQVPHPGQELSVFLRLTRAEVSPQAGKVRVYPAGTDGEVVRVVGSVKVDAYDPETNIARAEITEAIEPIERGFEVANVPRRLIQVPPRTNAQDLDARIVAAARPIGTLGQNQVVFIDAGSEQGVQVGNRFTVLRQGDTWRRGLTLKEELSGASRPDPDPIDDSDFPKTAVGEARVLLVRSRTCTALITEALVELNPGDAVRLREGY